MIIGIKGKDRVVLGFACWALSEVNDRDKTLEDNLPFKVFEDEGVIVACAERERSADILFADEAIENEIKEGKTSYEYVVNDIAPKIYAEMEQEHLLDEGRWPNCFVVAKGNSLSDVTPSFFVQDVEEYLVHGYVTEYIKSFLKYNADMPVEERIVGAFRFHVKMMGEHVFPIVLIDTKNFKVKVFTE